MDNYSINTKCVQAGYTPGNGEPRQIPIIQSTTFKYDTSEDMGKLFDLEASGYFYTRLQNPTNDYVAAKIAALEGGSAAMLTSSGQAANFFALFNICEAGSHIVASSSIYGGTFNLIDVTLKKMGIEATFVDPDCTEEELNAAFKDNTRAVFGETIANPALTVLDIEKFANAAHAHGVPLIVDNTFPTPVNCRPIEWGADIVFGTTQRLGTPMFYGGPSAAFFATKDEYKRNMPGRIIGWSKDKYGKLCYRMALQTREQHIKREKATSNICTAQALLATMAGFYAVYHGQEGITTIASRIHSITVFLEKQLKKCGYTQVNAQYFDTLRFELPEHVSAQQIRTIALTKEVNLRYYENGNVGFSIDETTDVAAANVLLSIFAIAAGKDYQKVDDIPERSNIDKDLKRTTPFLTHEVFSKYHTETEMMRYIKRLDRKDISLAQSMISLGSCTMKLNAAAEMLPLSRPEFMGMHPLVPEDQAEGYRELIKNLSEDLKVITGFAGVSLQPNSGAAGEYAGLRVIRAYLESIGQGHRNKVLIPASAHGTNPASAIQAGFVTVTCACDEQGNVEMADLRVKAEENKDELENTKKQFENAKIDVKIPFDKENELKEKSTRLDRVNALLKLDEKESIIMEDDEKSEDDNLKSQDYDKDPIR